MLKDLPVERFVRELASPTPVPGGAGASALAGAQAAGLLSMYCNLSQNREMLGDMVDVLQKAGEEARYIMFKMLEAIDEDTVAFNQVMEAHRLPKELEEQARYRNRAIGETAAKAIDVPMLMARASMRTLDLIGQVSGKGNPATATSLVVANLQAYSALAGACCSASANLEILPDKERVKEASDELDELLRQGLQFYKKNRALNVENHGGHQ